VERPPSTNSPPLSDRPDRCRRGAGKTIRLDTLDQAKQTLRGYRQLENLGTEWCERIGKRVGNLVTEDRIIQTLAALAHYDPRDIVQWSSDGVTVTASADLSPIAVQAIKEISIHKNGEIRFKFHDRRAALMDLARLRGMITDKSATFHFHEDLARRSPDDQKRRVAELLEFAASIKVPGDDWVDVTPEEPDEQEPF
jgi:hypothetical protein